MTEESLADYVTRLKQENEELKEVKEQLKKWNDENLKRQDDMQLWIDLAEEQRKNYRSALEEIRSAIVKYLPKKQGDYNFSKSLNPAQYALLEYIQIQINEVIGE